MSDYGIMLQCRLSKIEHFRKLNQETPFRNSRLNLLRLNLLGLNLGTAAEPPNENDLAKKEAAERGLSTAKHYRTSGTGGHGGCPITRANAAGGKSFRNAACRLTRRAIAVIDFLRSTNTTGTTLFIGAWLTGKGPFQLAQFQSQVDDDGEGQRGCGRRLDDQDGY